jgi:acyl-coenzyme A thioesterase PaaI-like protein
MKTDKAKELQRYFEKNLPLYKHIGLKILEARNGVAKCFVPLNDRNSNHFGVLHAAVQWAVAEALGGVIGFGNFGTEEILTVIKEFSIAFKQPAATDITSETSISPNDIDRVRNELDHIGKSEFMLEIELKNSFGEVVATATGLYHSRKRALYQLPKK